MSRMLEFSPKNPPVAFYPMVVAAGDVNGDGHRDVVAGSPYTPKGADTGVGAAWCFLGPDFQRDIMIEDPTPVAEGLFARSIAMGDYDADGFADVATASKAELCPEAYRCGEALVFFGPDFARTHRFPDPPPGRTEVSGTFRVARAEIDGDGIDDLVLVTTREGLPGLPGMGSFYVFHGPDFQRRDHALPVNAELEDVNSAYGFAVAIGDLTGDGLDEIALGAPNRDLYNNGQAGVVHVYDFSTRHAFRSYRLCSARDPKLEGVGDGGPDGSSKLVATGLSSGLVTLLVGTDACSLPFSRQDSFTGCEPRLLVIPEVRIDLGAGHTDLEYVLRLPREPSMAPSPRYRFQLLELGASGLRASNGVVWTVRW
jgi:hypothetical protein